MSGGRREASKPIDVYADEESDEDASSSDSDARAKSESLSLTEAAETLRELSLALCDAAIERRLIKKHTPKKRAKAKPIGKYAAKTKDPKQTTPAGETARRALRARHAMKVLNYAEPSLKTKLRRPSVFDENEERKVVASLALSPPRPLAPPPSPENSPPPPRDASPAPSVHHRHARQSTREVSARRHRRRPQNRTAVFADSPARRAFDSARRLPRARPRSQDASTVTFDPRSRVIHASHLISSRRLRSRRTVVRAPSVRRASRSRLIRASRLAAPSSSRVTWRLARRRVRASPASRAAASSRRSAPSRARRI